jgi:hypothetical protein
MSKSADSIAAREQVYNQLSGKFPKDAITWVKTVRWDPPAKYDLDEFDTDDASDWSASKDPKRVDHEIERWQSGRAHPIVTVQVGDGPLIIVDGHHRFLARERMHKGRALAFVGHVPNTTGPWMDTHLSQKGGDSA